MDQHERTLTSWSEEAVGDLERFLRRYVVLDDHQALVLALWVAHTWAFEAATMTPYLAVTSPTKQAGKSRLFEVLALLVREPKFTSAISPSALFHLIAQRRPTLLLDEVDARGISERLRGVLNSGYWTGGKVTQMYGQIPVDYPTFCPKAFAGIGNPLPDTVMDRSIPIRLKRRASDEHIERFYLDEASEQAETIQERLRAFSDPVVVEALASYRPEIPSGLSDRAADVWRPLLAIADLQAINCSEKAREAAVRLSGRMEEQDRGVQVLADLHSIFLKVNVDRIPTAWLLRALQTLEVPAFDGDYRHVSGADLARLLRAFEIRPKVMRIGSGPARGYERMMFDDAWRRYL